MLDLKAKLAAAGVVTKEQVEKFDKDQALARDKQRADEARAAERKAARSRPNQPRPNQSRPNQSRPNQSRPNQSRPNQSRPNQSRPNQAKPKQQRGPHNKTARDANPSGIDVEALKKLNRGDAYTRIRKIVDHSRLDDKERTIPKPDDQIFNFVTSKGKVSRLYLTVETAKSLSDGKTAISSFMSHHGLSHCVLPKEVALALAEVFPLWLRHLQGHADAGQIEVPEPPTEAAPAAANEAAPAAANEAAPAAANEAAPAAATEAAPAAATEAAPAAALEPAAESAPE